MATIDIGEFFRALSEVVANVDKGSVTRTTAAVMFKNNLRNNDFYINQQYRVRWHSIQVELRKYIKENVSEFDFVLVKKITNCDQEICVLPIVFYHLTSSPR